MQDITLQKQTQTFVFVASAVFGIHVPPGEQINTSLLSNEEPCQYLLELSGESTGGQMNGKREEGSHSSQPDVCARVRG